MNPKQRSFLVAFALLFSYAHAQVPAGAFSFRCIKRDTLSSCSPGCITLTTQIPYIGASSTNYTVSKINGSSGCFNPYASPDTGGSVAFISVDDRYSPLITLPFNFPFYGVNYSSLTLSGNGYVSFDPNTANLFSHYGILDGNGTGLSQSTGAPANLPNVLYDRSLIMAPYHDIDITLSSSPGRKIKMDFVGSAPHRKWIFSFYKIPLYSCDALIENTSQLVLNEGTGIVEIFVYSNQQCTAWNQGRSMIGMQNYDRNKGIMAPGRAASDAPWGTVNMNEAWRFTPSDGPPLLKKAELYTMNGQFVTIADTVNAGNGSYNLYFNNVCIDSSSSFIVKSTYKKIDDNNAEVYATDTIEITRQQAVAPTASIVNACGANGGSITITNPVGAGYTYSLNDGATYQSSNIFSNLPPGTYGIKIKDNNGCTYSLSVAVGVSTSATTTITYPVHAVCQTDTANIAPTVSGATGGRFSAVPAGLAIDSVSGLINIAGSATGLYQVTYQVQNAEPCFTPTATTSIRIADSSQFVWTGAVDAAWESAANWSCNNLPVSSSNVIIEQGNVIVSSNITVNSLSVMPGANLTVAPGFNITVLH